MYVVGGDFGRRGIKVFTGSKFIYFPAVVGEWRKMNLVNRGEKQDFSVEYNGEKFFVGVLAENESEFSRQMLTEDKVNEDTKLLALVALHQTGLSDIDLVTGVPINMHHKEQKENLSKLLLGTHDITVNGVFRSFTVQRVRVSVEGGGAFWSNPKDGLVRILDGGSKTINYITLKDRKFIDRDSGTLTFGFDTNKSADIKQMSNRIAGELGTKWSVTDAVFTVGGKAKTLATYLKDFYPAITTLQQEETYKENGMEIDLNLFANAIGYYNMGSVINNG